MSAQPLPPPAGPPPLASRFGRSRLPLTAQLQLVLLPVGTVGLMLALLHFFSDARLLFPPLASSAVFIYAAPRHVMNRVRSLLFGQSCAALAGFGCSWWLGFTYEAAALALTVALVLMVLTDAVHPPAAGTALTFAFRSGVDSSLPLFALAVGLLALLTLSAHGARRLIRRYQPPTALGGQ